MEKRKITHPLWTHLPAVAALVVLVVYLIMSLPLPAEAPVHFGFGGQADRYGSPWEVFGITIGLSLFFILLSAFLDELWVKQEKAKSFNWLSLMDEVVVGAMVGIGFGYLMTIRGGGESFAFPWDYFGWFCGGAVVLGVLVEMARPNRPSPQKLVAQENRALKEELQERLKDRASFVFWDSQNPAYITLLSTALPLIMLGSAVPSWFSAPWVSIMLIVVGLALVIPYGGQRTLVTPQEISIRWGLVGIRVFKLKIAEIADFSMHEFSPLKDFGGYGIRWNREMTAYYLRGNRGVKITTAGGKKYLIGSDHPERLLAVLQAVTGSNG
jgi:hypothetical protein